MSFKKFLKESYFDTIEVEGQEVAIFLNPSLQELNQLETFREWGECRFFVDKKNLYVFTKALHKQVIEKLPMFKDLVGGYIRRDPTTHETEVAASWGLKKTPEIKKMVQNHPELNRLFEKLYVIF